MVALFFLPFWRPIKILVRKTLGKQAGQLLSNMHPAWHSVLISVDLLMEDALTQFVTDSYPIPVANREEWKANGSSRTSFVVPKDDLRDWIFRHAEKTANEKMKSEPWFTLSKVGLTPGLQLEIVGKLARYRFNHFLRRRVGKVAGKHGATDRVIVSYAREPNDPLPGLPLLVRFAEMHPDDRGKPKKTKAAFSAAFKALRTFRRGTYDRSGIEARLKSNKYV
jgi:hypothetical protein